MFTQTSCKFETALKNKSSDGAASLTQAVKNKNKVSSNLKESECSLCFVIQCNLDSRMVIDGNGAAFS